MTTTTAPHLPSASWSGERRFFTSMSFAILAAVLLGFSRSFYLHGFFPTHPRPTEAFFTLHGVVFTAWFVLLCAQALLIANRRADLHRALGVAGAALAAVMVVVGMYGAVLAAARATGFVGIPGLDLRQFISRRIDQQWLLRRSLFVVWIVGHALHAEKLSKSAGTSAKHTGICLPDPPGWRFQSFISQSSAGACIVLVSGVPVGIGPTGAAARVAATQRISPIRRRFPYELLLAVR